MVLYVSLQHLNLIISNWKRHFEVTRHEKSVNRWITDLSKIVVKYAFNPCFWDTKLKGSNIIIDDLTIRHTDSSTSHSSVYLNNIIESGIHHWRVKINKWEGTSGYSIAMGLCPITGINSRINSYSCQFGMAFEKICLYSLPYQKGNGVLKNGDIIDIFISFKDSSVTFQQNGGEKQIFFNKTPLNKEKHKFGISLYNKVDCVTLMEYNVIED